MKAWYWRLSGGSVTSMMVAGFVTISAIAALTEAPLARSSSDSETCRIATEAFMRGDTDAALAAIGPEPSRRKALQDHLTRMNYMLVGAVKGKKPRLERTLKDIELDRSPVSLQIWSFGEEEIFLIGCLFRIEGDGTLRFELQLRQSVEDILEGFKARLKETKT
ncbi:MAG TPA: hypothetical protein VE423_03145 [Microvirga sp.]|nr:hypothetical protein [Microvirga sp.]